MSSGTRALVDNSATGLRGRRLGGGGGTAGSAGGVIFFLALSLGFALALGSLGSLGSLGFFFNDLYLDVDLWA